MCIVLGNYLHNDYDGIVIIRKILQITSMRNSRKQNYVEVGNFFPFEIYTEVTGKR